MGTTNTDAPVHTWPSHPNERPAGKSRHRSDPLEWHASTSAAGSNGSGTVGGRAGPKASIAIRSHNQRKWLLPPRNWRRAHGRRLTRPRTRILVYRRPHESHTHHVPPTRAHRSYNAASTDFTPKRSVVNQNIDTPPPAPMYHAASLRFHRPRPHPGSTT